MTRETNFAILIYEGVEPIDVGATHGILSMARRVVPEIRMCLVAERAGQVRLSNGLRVLADYGYADCPPAEVLVVCGGPTWPEQCANQATLDLIRRFAASSTVASVCTGGMIVAASGRLEGRQATTKREIIGEEASPLETMRERHPEIRAVPARLVDTGSVITGGGVTLAIDVTLHLIERFFGAEAAIETARITEYQRAWKANKAALSDIVGDNEQTPATAS